MLGLGHEASELAIKGNKMSTLDLLQNKVNMLLEIF